MRQCPDPTSSLNHHNLTDCKSRNYLSKCSVTCKRGYKPEGNGHLKISTCKWNSALKFVNWDPPIDNLLRCKSKYCLFMIYILEQRWANYGPRKVFMRPAGSFLGEQPLDKTSAANQSHRNSYDFIHLKRRSSWRKLAACSVDIVLLLTERYIGFQVNASKPNFYF